MLFRSAREGFAKQQNNLINGHVKKIWRSNQIFFRLMMLICVTALRSVRTQAVAIR